MSSVTESLAVQFNLTDEERAVTIQSGTQSLFYNRVAWARSYLVKAGMLNTPVRGCIEISDRGIELLSQNPKMITAKMLKPLFESLDNQDVLDDKTQETSVERTPDELIAEGYQSIRDNLSDELLTEVKACTPLFFEKLVVDLLVKMGYGGSIKDAGQAIGKSGDGGIDGIIKEDRLGLDVIYIQAKKWGETVVTPAEIQKFVGALHGKNASKGVFITTSTFSKNAIEYASGVSTNVILIDGNQLAQLMIDYDVGVSSVSCYEIKKINSDFFNEE